MTQHQIAGVSLAPLIDRVRAAIDSHAEELTHLDQAIGDGDHGINMQRGFAAVAAKQAELMVLPFDQALQQIGMTLVMSVGGASGPLYGSLFMGMGKVSPDPPDSLAAAAALLAAGVDAVKRRGKSDVGAKTMLDVLVPVQAALAAAPDDPLATVRRTAAEALEATRDMRATKGRAAFLGERSIGHIDPGARSSALILATLCDVLEGR